MLDIFYSGDTFSGTYLGRIYKGIRTLDVTATLDESHKQLVVYGVNQSKDKAMETDHFADKRRGARKCKGFGYQRSRD